MRNVAILLACAVSLGATAPRAESLAPQVAPLASAIPQARQFAAATPAPRLMPTGPEAGSSLPRIDTSLRPPARPAQIPRTRWQHMPGHALWTRAALSALKEHGKPLVDMVPRDIANWCPKYPQASEAERRAFWVGFMSALAKHESTYKPWAVGGGGRWYGLLQILPSTARGYKCNARTGEGLMNGAANLSCAVRIMARTVPRDGVIHGYKGRKGQGVTADWGPMHSQSKRTDMASWLKRQTYCQSLDLVRPRARP